jgi:hypothetical protein
MFAMSGVLRASASKRSRSSEQPARRAMAIKCTSALVEPPIASTHVTALSNASLVRIFAGVTSSQTISTMRLPVAVAICAWRESGAGIDEAPGRERPSASTALIIVAAVPIVMHVPGERAIPDMMSSHCPRRSLPREAAATP